MSNPVTNCRRSITWLLRYTIPGSAASAPLHGSFATPSLAPLHPHHYMAPSLRHPWLRCIRTITWLLRYAIPGSAASAPSVHSQPGDDDVDELDSDERGDDAAQSVDEEIATQDRGRTHRA